MSEIKAGYIVLPDDSPFLNMTTADWEEMNRKHREYLMKMDPAEVKMIADGLEDIAKLLPYPIDEEPPTTPFPLLPP